LEPKRKLEEAVKRYSEIIETARKLGEEVKKEKEEARRPR